MIRFSKYIWVYGLISFLFLAPGIYSLIRYGLVPSVDFTGGTVIEFTTQNDVTEESVEKLLRDTSIETVEVSVSQGKNIFIKAKTTEDQNITQFENKLAEEAGTVEVVRKETVGPILGKELLEKAFIASILAIIAILSYVAYAFKNIRFGVSAIVALIHDVLIMFGSFSLLGHFFGVEVDSLFVTAFLTTMSFSVHDTIVIFDRIREYTKKEPSVPLSEISDIALTETMGRSLVNSFTIMFMLLALVLMGGESVRWFSVALLIGTTTGTYSSPFVATPVLLLWDKMKKK